jgi:hypothetical protein
MQLSECEKDELGSRSEAVSRLNEISSEVATIDPVGNDAVITVMSVAFESVRFL